MLLAELAGPSGVGKSAIYEAVEASGEITPAPKSILREALNAISGSEKFPNLIERIAHTAKGPYVEGRRNFLYRSLYKHVVAARSVGKPMVIDGGLVQRGLAVEQLDSDVTLKEFWQTMPVPDALFMVSADKKIIVDRNKKRGGDHDRSSQVNMAIRHFSRAHDALEKRGVHIVSIDAMLPVEQNACTILNILKGLS